MPSRIPTTESVRHMRGKLHPIMVPDLLPETAEMQEKAEVVLPDLLEVISYLKGDRHGI